MVRLSNHSIVTLHSAQTDALVSLSAVQHRGREGRSKEAFGQRQTEQSASTVQGWERGAESWSLSSPGSCPVQPSWLASSRVLEKVDEIVHSEWGNAGKTGVLSTKYANPHQTRKTLISSMELPSMAPSFQGRLQARDTPVSPDLWHQENQQRDKMMTRRHLSPCWFVSSHCTSKEVENSPNIQEFRIPVYHFRDLLYLFSCIWLSSVCWYSFSP